MKGKPGNPQPKPDFHGGPGSGRKSIKGRRGRKTAKEEHDRYTQEYDLMYSEQDIELLKNKVRENKLISPREIMLLRELGGSERLLATHYGKVVPDKIDFTSGGKPIPILEILRKKPK